MLELMMYKIEFTELFRDDIVDANEYLMDKSKSKFVVRNYFKTVYDKIYQIKEMPFAWSLVDDDHLASKGYRSFLAKNYLIFFNIIENEKVIRMYRFLHSSRDWASILKEDIEDENS